MLHGSFTIQKFEDTLINEDAVRVDGNFIAVSDGAGGGGLYADLWSRYLLEHLPEKPLDSFEALDEWIGQIWEPFYNECEALAKQKGGLILNKFYEEGSFATLVAVWKISDTECRWMSYGDSVAFHYDSAAGKLEHSFSKLADFAQPPHLINCKDELNPAGFHTGTFHINPNSIVFVASDAVSHYVLSLYELAHSRQYEQELSEAKNAHSKNAGFIMNIESSIQKVRFRRKMESILKNGNRHLENAYKNGHIGLDDYSFAFMDFRK